MRRNLYVAAVTALMVVTTGMTAFAGEWKTDANGKWYVNDDGSYAVNKWIQVEGNWYFADGTGYVMTNGVTPDGYHVDANGIWDGKSQDVNTTSTAQAGSGFVDILHAGMTDDEYGKVVRASLKEYWSGCPTATTTGNWIPIYDGGGSFLYRDYLPATSQFSGFFVVMPNTSDILAELSLGCDWVHKNNATKAPEIMKYSLYRAIGVSETERIWPSILEKAEIDHNTLLSIHPENNDKMIGVIRLNDRSFEGVTPSGNRYNLSWDDQYGNVVKIYRK